MNNNIMMLSLQLAYSTIGNNFFPGFSISPFHGSSSEDAGSLEPIICLACEARVMLTSNLWVDKGLVKAFSLSLLHLIQRRLHRYH